MYTFVPADRDDHDPVVQVTTDQFTDEKSDLWEVYSIANLQKVMGREWHTIGVPYDPETAKGVSPNPTGGGDPKKTAWVMFTPIPKSKAFPVVL
jgi:hypothetical protein